MTPDRDEAAGAGATRLETAAAWLHPANQQIETLNDPWPVVLIVTLIGLCGFVGLLVTSHYVAGQANILRVGALIWFLMFGLLRAALVRERKIGRPLKDDPAD